MVSEIDRSSDYHLELPDGAGRLEACWWGPEPDRAPTLVFLHEGLGAVALWRDFPRRLARMTGCGALLYSRLGYGGSDPCVLPRPVDFMHHEALSILPAVIRLSGIRDYLLVGHSDGGSIALIHAGGNPGAGLQGVVTLAAHVFCEDLTRRTIAAARQRYLAGDLRERLAVYHGKNTDCAFWGWNDVWLHPDFRSWSIEAFLPAIRVPLLVIQGENDPYGTIDQVTSIREKSGGVVTVEMIAGCGHAPHLQETEVILGCVVEFVNRVFGCTPTAGGLGDRRMAGGQAGRRCNTLPSASSTKIRKPPSVA